MPSALWHDSLVSFLHSVSTSKVKAGPDLPHSVLPLQDNVNIDEATRFLVEKILANQQSFPREENDTDKIKLTDEPLPTKARSQCCWRVSASSMLSPWSCVCACVWGRSGAIDLWIPSGMLYPSAAQEPSLLRWRSAWDPWRTVPSRGPVTYQMNPRLFLYCQMQSNVYSLGNIFCTASSSVSF